MLVSTCVDVDLKRQIKNQTLHTFELFLQAIFFQYTSISITSLYLSLRLHIVQIGGGFLTLFDLRKPPPSLTFRESVFTLN